MKYFKDGIGNVFAFEAGGSQDHAIPDELTPVTEAEADQLRKPKLSKDQVWDAIKAERDRRTDQGGFKVGIKWFHSDQKSRSQQLGLNLLALQVLAGGGTAETLLPGVTPWKTMSGIEVPMTAGLAQQILVAGAASDSAVFDAAKAHKVAMETSSDPSAYDFSGGWPATFEG